MHAFGEPGFSIRRSTEPYKRGEGVHEDRHAPFDFFVFPHIDERA